MKLSEIDDCSICPLPGEGLCPGGMVCYGGEPIEPPCTSWDGDEDVEDYIESVHASILEREEYEDRLREERENKKRKNEIAKRKRQYLNIYCYSEKHESIITINIDGKEIQSCGDTCIFEQKGLNAEVDFQQENIYSNTNGSIADNTYISGIVNKYKNMFGKSRIVVVKSQLGQPITAYSGDEVYWEIPEDLPKMTKLMIDGKALYIHRANFQIIDKALLD